LAASSSTFSIIVPVFNALAYLEHTATALRDLVDTTPDAELIFVDNGSTDGSWEKVKSLECENTKTIRKPDVNVGEVRNAGALMAAGSVLVFVDADCLVDSDYLESIRAAMEQSGAAAVGAYYSMSPDPNWLERSWHRLHEPDANGFTSWVPAGNLAVRADVFRSIGGFRADLSSGEDVDLCRRIEATGTPVYQSMSIVSRHLGNAQKASDFIRKHAWHGEGMIAAEGRRRLSRPLIMTVAHWVLIVATVALVLALRQPPVRSALLILLAVSTIPAVTVAYRSIQKRRFIEPISGVAAYALYYLARGVSLIRLLSRPASRRQPE
jgi:GT2 family glycosyltransferase